MLHVGIGNDAEGGKERTRQSEDENGCATPLKTKAEVNVGAQNEGLRWSRGWRQCGTRCETVCRLDIAHQRREIARRSEQGAKGEWLTSELTA